MGPRDRPETSVRDTTVPCRSEVLKLCFLALSRTKGQLRRAPATVFIHTFAAAVVCCQHEVKSMSDHDIVHVSKRRVLRHLPPKSIVLVLCSSARWQCRPCLQRWMFYYPTHPVTAMFTLTLAWHLPAARFCVVGIRWSFKLPWYAFRITKVSPAWRGECVPGKFTLRRILRWLGVLGHAPQWNRVHAPTPRSMFQT